jgi:hypothetical protein
LKWTTSFKVRQRVSDIVYTDNISVYEKGASIGAGNVSAAASFTLSLKEMTDTTFNVYSTSGGNFIKTFVKLTGINSGITTTFEVRIEN